MSQGTLRPSSPATAPKTAYNLTAISTNKIIAQGGTYILVRK